jgi:DNA-binding IclR family transcriptional regulator
VAAAIFDARGVPVGAVAAADWDPADMPPERLERVIEDTRETALAISHAIGFAGSLASGSAAPAPV